MSFYEAKKGYTMPKNNKICSFFVSLIKNLTNQPLWVKITIIAIVLFLISNPAGWILLIVFSIAGIAGVLVIAIVLSINHVIENWKWYDCDK